MKTKFDGLLSLSDAAKKWNRADNTMRQNIKNGKFVENVDVKKFGKQWVITEDAMIREYGEVEENK